MPRMWRISFLLLLSGHRPTPARSGTHTRHRGSKMRHVRLFKPEFAPKVESGAKLCTIRQAPKRAIWSGDALSLRTWTGKPYASKQRLLRETICKECVGIMILSSTQIRVNGNELNETEREMLALADGFESAAEMAAFFELEYQLPFIGVIISWYPLRAEPR